MSIRQVRQQLQALRQELVAPPAEQESSTLKLLLERLARMRERLMADPGYKPPTPEQQEEAKQRVTAFFADFQEQCRKRGIT